jgi:hypothetical protein
VFFPRSRGHLNQFDESRMLCFFPHRFQYLEIAKFGSVDMPVELSAQARGRKLLARLVGAGPAQWLGTNEPAHTP